MGIGRIACFFAGCCHGAVAPTPESPIGLLPEAFTGGQIWLSSTVPFLTNEVHGGVGRLHDIPIYPTQLWDAVTHLSIAGLLAWLWTRRKFDGQIAALALIIEPPFRAFSEMFRADERGYFVSWNVSDGAAALIPGMAQAGESMSGQVMGITTSQGIAMIAVVCGVVMYLARRKAGVTQVAPAAADDGDLLEELA
jgi:prolipoprotein diacylglyceryltransferase